MLHSRVALKLGIPADDLKNIKNIIFDLGGVIIDIHYQATIESFKKIGFNDFENIYSLIKNTPLFDMLETGKIPPQAFRNELRKFKSSLTDEQINTSWNTMIGNMPSDNLPLLRNVRKKYKTYLLSNTNAIHIDYFINYLEQKFGYNPLSDMFDKVYFSHEIGQRKPDKEAFETVLHDACLVPSETLFIDDLILNIGGARKAGLLAYHLENETIKELFIQ
jgi:putative hydrolase of the HAD superfamily